MDSNTTSGAEASTGSRIRYPRHPALLLTRAADEERNFWSRSSRHPGAAVARKTRAIGRELLRTVITLLLDAGVSEAWVRLPLVEASQQQRRGFYRGGAKTLPRPSRQRGIGGSQPRVNLHAKNIGQKN